VEVTFAAFAVTASWWRTSTEAIVAAAQPTAASTIPAAAAALIGTAAKVVSLPDIVTGDCGIGRHALVAVLAGITGSSNVYARIDRDVGAKAVVTGGRPAAGRVEIAATTLVGAAAVIAGDSHEIAGEGSIRADAD
jgi:hypothetical protein